MHVLFNIVMPVFGLVVTGYFAGRSGVLNAAAAAPINRFVYYFALPPLMFTFTARAPVAESLNWPFIGAFFVGSVLTFAVAYAVSRIVFRNDTATSIMHGHAAAFANTVYMGIPLFLLAFGEQGTVPAITAGVTQLFIIAPVIAGVDVCLNRVSAPGRLLWDVGRSMATNPLLIAAMAGTAFAWWGAIIPAALATYLDMLGRIASPAALFTLGLSLVGQRLAADKGEVGWIAFAKLIIHPLAVGLLGAFAFDLTERGLQSAILLAALPSGALVYVVAQRFDLFVARASASIIVSTALSVATVSGLLMWMLGV